MTKSRETMGMTQDCPQHMTFTLAITGEDPGRGTREVTIYPPTTESAEGMTLDTLGHEPVLQIAQFLESCHYSNQCSGNSFKCVVMKPLRR